MQRMSAFPIYSVCTANRHSHSPSLKPPTHFTHTRITATQCHIVVTAACRRLWWHSVAPPNQTLVRLGCSIVPLSSSSSIKYGGVCGVACIYTLLHIHGRAEYNFGHICISQTILLCSLMLDTIDLRMPARENDMNIIPIRIESMFAHSQCEQMVTYAPLSSP